MACSDWSTHADVLSCSSFELNQKPITEVLYEHDMHLNCTIKFENRCNRPRVECTKLLLFRHLQISLRLKFPIYIRVVNRYMYESSVF